MRPSVNRNVEFSCQGVAALAAIALLAACPSETTFKGGDTDTAALPLDSQPPDDDTGDTKETNTPPIEECNGRDDDGDGEVDEGFPDEDGNGRVDCLDVTCPALDTEPAGGMEVVPACETGPATRSDPWNIVTEWSYTFDTGGGAVGTPMTGQLTDDDADGVLGSAGDIPDVAVANWWWTGTGATLAVLTGSGGGEWFSVPGLSYSRSMAVADVTGDGWSEILFYAGDDTVQAVDTTGAPVWGSATYEFSLGEQLTVADLDGDGVAEVIADRLILDGRDGSQRALLGGATWHGIYRSPAVGDLDRDGAMEIVLGPDVFDADGNLLWSISIPGTASTCFGALVQADTDPEGEVVFVADDGYRLHNTDGSLLAYTGLPPFTYYTDPGPPCVADFDGDGVSEIGIATYGNFGLYELDGTQVWSVAATGPGLSGCSGFDFDEDGVVEVLQQDLDNLVVRDGPTGAARWSGPRVGENVGVNVPYVVDIDGDGAAEIVSAGADGYGHGIDVFGQAVGDWPGAGPTWGTSDFSETTLEDDGGVPTNPTPPWDLGIFRSRLPRDTGQVDLLVEVTDVCVADCTFGPVAVAVSVANQGKRGAVAGMVLEIVAVDDTTERVVARIELPAIPAATRLDPMELSLAPGDVGTRGFAARVDPEGLLPECVETNNRAEWLKGGCP